MVVVPYGFAVSARLDTIAGFPTFSTWAVE